MKRAGKNRPSFVVFCGASLLSAFGYEFIYFIMTVHIYDINKNALNIGLFTALAIISRLFSPMMGGIADRYGKVRCFSISSALSGVLLLLMSFASTLPQIYIIWFLTAVFLNFISNTRASLVAEVTAGEKYSSGNALILAILNGARILGPLTGGFIALAFSIRPLIYFTSALYFLVAVLSSFIRPPARHPAARQNFIKNMKAGFGYIRENRVFGMLAYVAFFWRLFLGMQTSLFIVYVNDCLAGSGEQYGVLMSVIGIGSIIGSLLGPFAARCLKPALIIPGGLGIHFLLFIALALCRNYYLALAIAFSGYVVFYATLVSMHSARDRAARSVIRGSAYGAVSALLTPPAVISMLAGGWLSDLFNPSVILAVAALLSLLSTQIILFINKNALRSLEGAHSSVFSADGKSA